MYVYIYMWNMIYIYIYMYISMSGPDRCFSFSNFFKIIFISGDIECVQFSDHNFVGTCWKEIHFF